MKIVTWVVIAAAFATSAALLYLEYGRDRPGALELTAAERAWLDERAAPIRVAPIPNAPPIDFSEAGGPPRGLTPDYLRLIERQLGVRFETVPCASWKEVLAKLKNREVDLVGSVQRTAEREDYLLFTKPYLSVPTVIITQKDRAGKFGLDNLGGLEIVVVEDSATHSHLRKTRPDYRLTPVANAARGFERVSFNRADVMVTDLAVASHYIKELGISNLRVAGQIDYPWELRIASRADWPILHQLLEKALAAIPRERARAIQADWITLGPSTEGADHYLRLFGGFLLLTLLAIGAITFRNQTLRKQVHHHSKELGRVRERHEQTSRALDESEARFRGLVESSTDVMWETDRYGAYLYISPRVREILGYDPDELVGTSAHALMEPADAAQAMENLRKRAVDSTIDRETNTYLHRDGRRVILESSGMAFADHTGRLAGFRGVSRDITERVERENALRRSEERFRNLVETTSDWIWEVDPEGRYTYSSPQIAELLGRAPNEVLGTSFLNLIPTADRSAARAAFHKTLEQGEALHALTSNHLHTDGRLVVLETSAVPFHDKQWNIQGIRGISRDITRRQQAEQQLRRVRALLSNTIDSMPSILVGVDAAGEVIQWNRQAAEITGRRAETVIGTPLERAFPELSKEMEKVERAIRERATQKQERIRDDRDGRPRYTDLTVYPLLDGGGQGAVIRIDDVTDRVMIENCIRNIVEGVSAVGNRFFHSMVEQLANALGADYAFISAYADDARETMRTIAVADKGQNAANFDFTIARTPCEAVLRSGECVHIPGARARYPETKLLQQLEIEDYIGIPLVNSARGNLGVMVAMYRAPLADVEFARSIIRAFAGRTAAELERLQATKELVDARDLLANIVNSTPSILMGVDAERRVVLWNARAESLSGVAASTAANQPLDHILPNLGSEITAALETLSTTAIRQHQHLPATVQGADRIMDLTIFPISNRDGRGAVIRLEDVTDRVRIEEMMVQSEKMMSVGGLAAGMAHEINNPLAGILQNLQVMRNRLTQQTERNTSAALEVGTTLEAVQNYMQARGLTRMMDSIAEAGRRAAKIVDNMLSFSRKDEACFAPNDLRALIERSLELAANDYNLKKNFDFRHIRVQRQFEALDPVPCEGGQVQQVLLNLLSNSAQAMADQPDAAREPEIIVRLKAEAEHALIEVEDNGPGMDAQTRKRVFEPFFTTKEVGLGTGLGLSVSYFIITETHGGSMSVSSAPGEGARFSLRLPYQHHPRHNALRAG